MAHAKTSALQLSAQIAAGSLIAYTYWTNFVAPSKPATPAQSPQALIDDLELESRTNTSGKFWGLDQRDTDQRRPTN